MQTLIAVCSRGRSEALGGEAPGRAGNLWALGDLGGANTWYTPVVEEPGGQWDRGAQPTLLLFFPGACPSLVSEL
jgi:hypothetical protein